MPHAVHSSSAPSIKPVFPLAVKLGVGGVLGVVTVASYLNRNAINALIDNNMSRSKDLLESRRIRIYEEEERIKQRKLEWQLLSFASYGSWTKTRSQVKFLQDKLDRKDRNTWQDLLQELEENNNKSS
ncbi:hypothetical protein FDP41_011807 [Naegleria fowleri]|uniref:Uncharacterized protein n=1 Tax=Naegleria fowleri TaxID=5763 RepID=A0A6A5C2M1_NAEFO|nr:uncharacterized protein FDP41_011807 [Naegleria fowleri]KAF0981946.1 hypothetical protein FDP41_011807 [Naegleria fowleri]CAG4711383.1 unnamed protein product [Naegleria fowleri]